MAAIDIGAAATDRAADVNDGLTIIALDNPANDTGKLDTIEIWAGANLAGVKVGTFYGSSTDYTSRDSHTIGNVTSGSKQTFSGLSIDCTSGDYIGFFATADSGTWDRDTTGGAGIYYKSGDQFGAGQQTYTLISGNVPSVYGTGETAGVTHEGTATLSGVGTLAGKGVRIFTAKSTLSGAGTLAGIGRGIFIGKSTLSGAGTLAGIGRLIAIGKATLSGIGTLATIGRRVFTGVATLSGIGTLSAIGQRICYGVVALAGVGSLSAIGRGLFIGKSTLSGVGTLVGRGVITAFAPCIILGDDRACHYIDIDGVCP